MNNEIDDEELITRKLSGELSEREQKLFEKKMDSDQGFKEKADAYDKIWRESSMLKIPKSLSSEDRWVKISTALPVRTERSISPYLKYAAVVALLLVAVSAFFLLKLVPDQMTISTANGETKKIEFPDHSIVTLNANSRLAYFPSEFSSERVVELKGEAYFEVKKSKTPFIVRVNSTEVEVLGTTFNIQAYDQVVDVACATGKVRVSTAEDVGQILTQGKGVKVIEQKLSDVFEINAENIAAWREGKLYFKETPIKEVFAEIERYYDVKINISASVKNRTFTGEFDRPNLREMLQTICLSAALEYEFVGRDTIKIY